MIFESQIAYIIPIRVSLTGSCKVTSYTVILSLEHFYGLNNPTKIMIFLFGEVSY